MSADSWGTLTTERALPLAPKSAGNHAGPEVSKAYSNEIFKNLARSLAIQTISIAVSRTPIYRMEFKPASSTFAPNSKSAQIASISVVSVKLIVYIVSLNRIVILIVSRTVVLVNRSKRSHFGVACIDSSLFLLG